MAAEMSVSTSGSSANLQMLEISDDSVAVLSIGGMTYGRTLPPQSHMFRPPSTGNRGSAIPRIMIGTSPGVSGLHM